MRKFFISTHLLKKIIVLSMLISFFLPFEIFVTWFFFLALFFLAFKKNKVFLNDAQSSNVGVIVSPVSGTVLDVKLDKNEATYTIKSSCFRNFGIYFPLSGSVGQLAFSGGKSVKSLNTKRMNKQYCIEFINKQGHKAKVIFSVNLIGFYNHIWIKLGDKGRVNANLGFVPFGGVFDVVLDVKSNPLVSVGDRVLAGSTPLVGLKGK